VVEVSWQQENSEMTRWRFHCVCRSNNEGEGELQVGDGGRTVSVEKPGTGTERELLYISEDRGPE